MVVPLVISFPYKLSILGYPHLWKSPDQKSMCRISRFTQDPPVSLKPLFQNGLKSLCFGLPDCIPSASQTWLAEKKTNWRFGWENHRKKHDHFPAMFDYQPWACSIWGGWDGPDDMMVISYFPIISNHIPWKRKSRKKSPPTKAKNPEKPSNPHPMSGLLLVAGLAKLICQGLAHLQRIGVAAHGIQGHTLLNKTSVADAWRFNVCCEGDTRTHTQHNGRIRKGGKVRRSCGNLRLNISFGGLL